MQDEKKQVDDIMKEIAQTIWKRIDAPEVQEIYNKIKEEHEKLQEKMKKKEEETQKKAIEGYKEQVDKQKELRDAFQDNIDKLAETRKAYQEMKEDAVDSLRSIRNEQDKLYENTSRSLAQRKISIDKEKEKIQEDLKKQSKKVDNVELNSEANYLLWMQDEEKRKKWIDTLKDLEEYKGIKSDDIIKRYENLKKLKDLEEELALIYTNADKDILEDEEGYQKLSKAEQILTKFSNDSQKLQEQERLQDAIKNKRKIDVKADENGITAFVENEEGIMKEISDFANKEQALDLEEKRKKLLDEETNLKNSLANQYVELQKMDQKKRDLEKEYSSFLGKEIEKRVKVTDKYIKKIKELIALQWGTDLNLPTVPTSTSNTNKQTVINNYNTVHQENTNYGIDDHREVTEWIKDILSVPNGAENW